METDRLFYQLFLRYPQLFFELIGEPRSWARRYQFQSVELKATASRIDGLFVPDAGDAPLFFVEVQFQKQPDLYARLFKEIFICLHQYRSQQDWRAVAIFASRATEPDAPDCRPYRGLLAAG